MNTSYILSSIIIASSIIISTIAYLYFNNDARCERNYVKMHTFGISYNSEEDRKEDYLEARIYAHQLCSGQK